MKRLAPVLLGLLMILSCNGGTPEAETSRASAPAGPVGKVAVFADGSVKFNGQATDIEALKRSLSELAEHNGQVWYYREAGESEPAPEVMKVFQALVEAKLPMSLSSEPDFSTVVDADGRIRPRE